LGSSQPVGAAAIGAKRKQKAKGRSGGLHATFSSMVDAALIRLKMP